MLYKCAYCNYTTTKPRDLRRHNNRKYPCNNRTKVNVDISKETANVKDITENVNVLGDNYPDLTENINVLLLSANGYKCSKCNKVFTRNINRKNHESKCTGLNVLQCEICLKMFSSASGKSQHKKYVECFPSKLNTTTPQTINNTTNNINHINTTNNIDNSTTNNNIQNNNIHVTLNFGNEDLTGLINDPNYMKNVEECMERFITDLPYLNEDAGKLIIAEILKQIYFNKNFPQNQTIIKTNKKDNIVKIHRDNQWKSRVINDVSKNVTGKVEQYFVPYFENLSNRYENCSKNDIQGYDKIIINNTRGFGNRMVWYDWDEAIEPIVKINNMINKMLQLPNIEEEDENDEKNKDIIMQKKIMRNTIKCLSQELYDNTKMLPI